MLGKLIKSQNPEDLRAANRLIRDMVRRVSERERERELEMSSSLIVG